MKTRLKKIYKRFFSSGDIDYLVKNSPYKLTYQIIYFILGFLIFWLFGNFTSQEFYGMYLFITNTMAFFSFLSFPGINQSLIQSTANGYDYFYKTAIKKNSLYALSGSFVFIGYVIFYYFFIEANEIIVFAFILEAIFYPFITGLSLYLPFLAGKGNFKLEFIYSMISYTITLLLLLNLILFTQDLILYFLLLKLISVVLAFFFTLKTLKKVELDVIDLDLDKKAMRYGLNLTKYNVITLICANINGVIVGIFYGPAALASYNVGIGISLKLYHFLKPSLSVLLTKYSAKDAHISRRFLFLIVLGSILLFIGINLVLPFYLQILFPLYLDSFGYGFAYSFVTLISPIVIVIGYYFRGKAEVKIVRNAMLLPDFIGLAALAPLVILFGIYGLILNDFLRLFLRLIIYGLYWKKMVIN